MSTDLTTMLKSAALVETGLDADTQAVAGGMGAGKRISIKAGVFRKYAGGKEVATVEDRHMDVIFVKMAHTASRMYYKDAYAEGAKVSPLCWSSDSRKPDDSVPNKVATACDTCPMAVKGSGRDGKSAACRLSWRTAVVLPSDPSGDVLQLVLPAASVFGKEEAGKWPFRAYIQMLASNNVSASRVVTKMQFDTKASSPKLLFSPVGVVQADVAGVVADQGKSPAAEQAVKLTVFQPQDGDDGAEEAAPAQPAIATAEPTVRATKEAIKPVADVAEVISKWTKK